MKVPPSPLAAALQKTPLPASPPPTLFNTRPTDSPLPLSPPPTPAADGDLVQRIKRSCVLIECEFGPAAGGIGSGFFAGRPGFVITNAHVVGYSRQHGIQRPTSVKIVLNSGESDQRELPVTIYGLDATLGIDLALLKVDAPNLPPLIPIGSNAQLKETEDVMIFGYPHADKLGQNISVNKSTISSLRKENGKVMLVQVAGGINPGNSGGPIVNTAGQLIGVSMATLRDAQQIDFAIPPDTVTAFLNDQFATNGRINSAGLKPARPSSWPFGRPSPFGRPLPAGPFGPP